MTSSGDDTRVGTTVPSTLVDPSSRTKTTPPKKTTSTGSSKEDAAIQGGKGASASQALVVQPVPKLTTPRELPLRKATM